MTPSAQDPEGQRLRRMVRQRRPIPPDAAAVREALDDGHAPAPAGARQRTQLRAITGCVVLGLLVSFALPKPPEAAPDPTPTDPAAPEYGTPRRHPRALPVSARLPRAERRGLAFGLDGGLLLLYRPLADDPQRTADAIAAHWRAATDAANQWLAATAAEHGRDAVLLDDPATRTTAARSIGPALFPAGSGELLEVGWARLSFTTD